MNRVFSVFMWRKHIPKLNITFPSEVSVLSDKRPYRNLTFHNVLAEQVSVAKLSDRCFCYFTAAMFVSLRRTQTWRLHTKLYKFGRHSSANNTWMKNSRDLILGKVVYISIIYRISDSWLFSLNGCDFYFDQMTGENREST